jgi:hypothetical protein
LRRGFGLEELRVERLDLLERAGVGRTPVRVITDDLARLVQARRDMGEDPIVVAVLRHVLHIGEDLPLLFERVPEQLEDRARHVWMAHDRMRLVQRLLLGEVGDLQENVVGVDDAPLQIRLGDDDLVLAEPAFSSGRRHGVLGHVGRLSHRLWSNPVGCRIAV